MSARFERGSRLLAAAVLLIACAGPQASHPAASSIDVVGLISAQRIYADEVVFTLENGKTWSGQTGTYRTVMNWGAKLLVVGHDAEGLWIATFGPQGGLPESCYFTPEPGTEWADGFAIAGDLWAKAAEFSPMRHCRRKRLPGRNAVLPEHRRPGRLDHPELRACRKRGRRKPCAILRPNALTREQ